MRSPSDLVERLRQASQTCAGDAVLTSLLSEAAVEIERLRTMRRLRGVEQLLADVNGTPITYEAMEALLDAAIAHALAPHADGTPER